MHDMKAGRPLSAKRPGHRAPPPVPPVRPLSALPLTLKGAQQPHQTEMRPASASHGENVLQKSSRLADLLEGDEPAAIVDEESELAASEAAPSESLMGVAMDAMRASEDARSEDEPPRRPRSGPRSPPRVPTLALPRPTSAQTATASSSGAQPLVVLRGVPRGGFLSSEPPSHEPSQLAVPLTPTRQRRSFDHSGQMEGSIDPRTGLKHEEDVLEDRWSTTPRDGGNQVAMSSYGRAFVAPPARGLRRGVLGAVEGIRIPRRGRAGGSPSRRCLWSECAWRTGGTGHRRR